MKNNDNIIKFPKKQAEDILEAIRKSMLAQGLNELNQPTPIQRKIQHLQDQLGCIWLSIPNEGTNIEDPDEWEPWMLKSIVQTLNELDKFLVDWYRDEDRY